MATGTYNNPRAGSNGSKGRMKNLTDKVNKDYIPGAEQKRPKPETTTKMGRTSKGRYEITTKTFYKKPKTYDHKSDPNKIYQAAEPRKIVVKEKTKAIDKNKSLHSQKGKIKNADKKTRTVKRFKK